MKNYRIAFYAVLSLNLILAAGLGAWWWQTRAAHAQAPVQAKASAASKQAGKKTGKEASQASSPAANGAMPGKAEAPANPPLAPLQLSPQRLQSIGVTTGTVERKTVHDDIRFVGNVAVDEQKQAYVQTRFSGWIQQVFANSNYQYVKKGQPLFTIYSQDLVTTEREYLLAKQNEQLLASSTVPGVASGAKSLVSAAIERLRQWNLPEREIARLRRTGKVKQYLTIDSPVSGFITKRNALPNMYVQPATRLYTVADFSTVWVFAEVFQNDLGRIHAGEPATLTVDSYPGRTFRGRVDFIYPDVNMTTRTARVRLVFSNPGLLLRPGMFVNVDLQIPMGRQIIVPATAVFQAGTQQLAFLYSSGGRIDPRNVVVGPQVGNQYIVLKGLKPGERIVTSANFLIDSESQLQAAVGSFLPPASPAGGETAGASAAQDKIQFNSIPSPPAKGTNTFQVKIADAKGQPVRNAAVDVLFYMPGMPSMGMAAMRAQFTLTGKGGGTYEGQGKLPAGGNWQVTIVARQAGKVVASKQLNVSVNGGM